MGDGTTSAVVSPTSYEVDAIATVAASFETLCALTTAGGVECWGRNATMQAGAPNGADATSPVTVADANGPLGGCTAIAPGGDHSCAICEGRPVCWGQNQHDETGRGGESDPTAVAAPVLVPAGTFVELTAFAGGACAITTDHRLYCWGNELHGELGDGGHGTNLPTPIAAPR